MDKIFSARLDVKTISKIEVMAKYLDFTKKKLIEMAIDNLCAEKDPKAAFDVLDQTHGAWKPRKSKVQNEINDIRSLFNTSFRKHQK
ncbi:MAG: hypothetical protein ACD_73C00117G0001 [uncultured bacterium]|nr:MAG: hypothetical protein ACD_73C00117G0001 [uncultured bacterium]